MKLPPPKFYVCIGPEHTVSEVDVLAWGRWLEDIDGRRVGNDHVGDVHISTVCVGLDHRHYGKGPPITRRS
jgi:hypothetical protein